MLRRLVILVALIGPTVGLAQTAGTVQITPSTLGSDDCKATTKNVTLKWTSSVTPVAGVNEIYKVWVSLTETTCPTTDPPAGFLRLGSDILVTALPPTYSTTSKDFISTTKTSCTTNETIFVCVQHYAADAATAKGTATGSAKLEVLPPSIPVNVSVEPGDTALFVSWEDGTDSTVAAVSYNVTAVGSTGRRTQPFTGQSGRISGLTNDITYSVTVTSVSAGGNESVASEAVTGMPKAVDNFWNKYTGTADHREQGGCGGGPAGLVSLLGVALALRGLRRRS